MFTTEFEAEVEESESATLHQYYREAMIQGYNFAFEVTLTLCIIITAAHLSHPSFYSQLVLYIFLNNTTSGLNYFSLQIKGS